METPEDVVKKARPFFLSYFQKLASDLHTLIDAPVVCTLNGVTLLRGEKDLSTLFEMDRSVAYVREDGLDTGDVHLVFDVTTSIALAGLMMMMGEAVIQSKIKIREYNDEIKEGFQEVSNQIVGALNDQIESQMEDGGHLIMESTAHVGFGDLPPTLDSEVTYLSADVEIKVADLSIASAHWLLSKGLAEAILQLHVPGTPEEEAQGGGGLSGEKGAESRSDGGKTTSEAAGAVSAGGGDSGSDSDVGFESAFDVDGDLPAPDEPGSVKVVMTETPFSMKEDEPIKRAIVAMLQDGYRYIGIERKGVLVRVISQSDLRQVMGPFYGSSAATARDKAIFNLPIGKLNERQKVITITVDGTINQAAGMMLGHKMRALPVVSSKGVIRGFIPVHAVLDYFRKKSEP